MEGQRRRDRGRAGAWQPRRRGGEQRPPCSGWVVGAAVAVAGAPAGGRADDKRRRKRPSAATWRRHAARARGCRQPLRRASLFVLSTTTRRRVQVEAPVTIDVGVVIRWAVIRRGENAGADPPRRLIWDSEREYPRFSGLLQRAGVRRTTQRVSGPPTGSPGPAIPHRGDGTSVRWRVCGRRGERRPRRR